MHNMPQFHHLLSLPSLSFQYLMLQGVLQFYDYPSSINSLILIDQVLYLLKHNMGQTTVLLLVISLLLADTPASAQRVGPLNMQEQEKKEALTQESKELNPTDGLFANTSKPEDSNSEDSTVNINPPHISDLSNLMPILEGHQLAARLFVEKRESENQQGSKSSFFPPKKSKNLSEEPSSTGDEDHIQDQYTLWEYMEIITLEVLLLFAVIKVSSEIMKKLKYKMSAFAKKCHFACDLLLHSLVAFLHHYCFHVTFGTHTISFTMEVVLSLYIAFRLKQKQEHRNEEYVGLVDEEEKLNEVWKKVMEQEMKIEGQVLSEVWKKVVQETKIEEQLLSEVLTKVVEQETKIEHVIKVQVLSEVLTKVVESENEMKLEKHVNEECKRVLEVDVGQVKVVEKTRQVEKVDDEEAVQKAVEEVVKQADEEERKAA